MPLIKSAIKKLRQDRVRESRNDEFRKKLRDTLRQTKKSTAGIKVLQEAYSVVDKAAKMNLMHANKAARLKSQIAKSIKPVKANKPRTSS